MKKRAIIYSLLGVVLIAFYFSVVGFPDLNLHEQTTSICSRCGMLREKASLCGIRYRNAISDTPISKVAVSKALVSKHGHVWLSYEEFGTQPHACGWSGCQYPHELAANSELAFALESVADYRNREVAGYWLDRTLDPTTYGDVRWVLFSMPPAIPDVTMFETWYSKRLSFWEKWGHTVPDTAGAAQVPDMEL